MSRDYYSEMAKLVSEIPIELIEVLSLHVRDILDFHHNLAAPVQVVDVTQEIHRTIVVENQITNLYVRISSTLLLGKIEMRIH